MQGSKRFNKRGGSPWSKLKVKVYNVIAPVLLNKKGFQLHCVKYPMSSVYGSTDCPRYWITIGKDIVWDYPADFLNQILSNYSECDTNKKLTVGDIYPYDGKISKISILLNEYLDTSKNELFDKKFKNDRWGLTNILKSADRRIGKRRLCELKSKLNNRIADKIIKQRMTQDTAEKI